MQRRLIETGVRLTLACLLLPASCSRDSRIYMLENRLDSVEEIYELEETRHGLPMTVISFKPETPSVQLPRKGDVVLCGCTDMTPFGVYHKVVKTEGGQIVMRMLRPEEIPDPGSVNFSTNVVDIDSEPLD